MKKLIIWIAIGVIVVCGIGAAVLFGLQYKKKVETEQAEAQARIEELEIQNLELEERVAELGQTATIYQLCTDVKSGTVVKETDFEPIDIPVAEAGGYVEDLNEIVGWYYILGMNAGEKIRLSDVYKVPLKKDDRRLDVFCDRPPVDFEAGDIVDVRIKFPNGNDYILMNKKLVEDIYGSVMRLVVDEKDIIIYGGAENDWARYTRNGVVGTSVQIYCTKYIEAGAQNGDRFYPIPRTLSDGVTYEGSILWTALQDSNLDEADIADWLIVDRAEFEKSMINFDNYYTTQKNKDTGKTEYVYDAEKGAKAVSSAQGTRTNSYNTAIQEFEKREAARKKEEAAAAKQAAKDAAKEAKNSQ